MATATYPVAIVQSSDLSDPAQMDVRAQMAIDQALWYVHTNQSRAQYPDGSPYYYQPYGYWDGGNLSNTCAALDALELRGSAPQGNWRSDPYVEDARRALNYVLANAQSLAITQQQYGDDVLADPDTNGNGIGIAIGGNSSNGTGINGECAKALADSGTPAWTAQTGPSNVYGRTYHDIAQDTVDWLAYSQVDSGYGEGGWGYSANSPSWVSNDLSLWPELAMLAAKKNMGVTVPPFVPQELSRFLNTTHHTAQDNLNGGWGLTGPNDQWVDDGRTGDGLTGQAELGKSPADSISVQPGLGFLYRHWNDTGSSSCWGAHIGWAAAMYRIMTGLVNLNVSRITEWNYSTGQQTTNGFDWYYAPSYSQSQGYATYLTSHQAANGSWTDSQDACGFTGDEGFGETAILTTAFDVLILLRDGVAALPAAPASVAATQSSGTVTVTWNVPASAGSPITSYTITCTDTSNNNISGCPPGTISVPAPANSTRISGLTAGRTYTFTVTATNAAGAGTASQPSNPVTVPAPTAAWVRAFHVEYSGSVAVFHWRVARASGIAGFDVYTGSRRLNARVIPVHTVPTYRYVVHHVRHGPYSLHVVLPTGAQVIVPAG